MDARSRTDSLLKPDFSLVSRSAIDTDVLRELEEVEGENFTIIEAAEDGAGESLDLLEAEDGEEGGTVIEVSQQN